MFNKLPKIPKSSTKHTLSRCILHFSSPFPSLSLERDTGQREERETEEEEKDGSCKIKQDTHTKETSINKGEYRGAKQGE